MYEVYSEFCGHLVRDHKGEPYTICAEKKDTMSHDQSSLYHHKFIPMTAVIKTDSQFIKSDS